MDHHIQFEMGLLAPHGGADLVAHLAYRNGWSLAAYNTAELRTETLFMIVLDVPEGAARPTQAFEGEIRNALRVQRGLPWLGVRELVAFLDAERAVAALEDEAASEMFALLRTTDAKGWGEVLGPLAERLEPYARAAGIELAGTAAVASVKALLALVA